ncbi:hypothetical protein [Vulcanisaeta distributa]|uniref:hypothetical protein n=1 Tax=Vulcanisaeta distributa TaxID=164451 RepID=UPI0006D295D8|nr:hypothetical protein [Vulcanisaeta distributa]
MWSPPINVVATAIIQWPLNTTTSLNCTETLTEMKIQNPPSVFTLTLFYVNFALWAILLLGYYYYGYYRVSGTYELGGRYYAHYVLYRSITYRGRGVPWAGALHLGLVNFLLVFNLLYTELCYASIKGLTTWPLTWPLIILLILLIMIVSTLIMFQKPVVKNAPQASGDVYSWR